MRKNKKKTIKVRSISTVQLDLLTKAGYTVIVVDPKRKEKPYGKVTQGE